MPLAEPVSPKLREQQERLFNASPELCRQVDEIVSALLAEPPELREQINQMLITASGDPDWKYLALFGEPELREQIYQMLFPTLTEYLAAKFPAAR